MYIEPNTDIVILKDCPLDTTYNHTLYFTDKTAQHNYFYSLKKYAVLNNTYQRVNKGKMRIQIKSDNLYDCNYIMFRNTSFGDKWFYAFITRVEYINNVTSEITFEIDVMQTWYFDYTVKECFVEREHSLTDEIGENTYPEAIESGEYITSGRVCTDVMLEKSLILASTIRYDDFYKTDGDSVTTPVLSYNGMYSGVYYNVFENTLAGMMDCKRFIDDLVEDNKGDSIVGLYQIPKFVTDYTVNDTLKKNGFAKHDIFFYKPYNDINGYIPRNKKLFVYPYNVLYCTNNQGTSAVYRYEDFNSPVSCDFQLTGDFSINCSVFLVPINYKTVNENRTTITDNSDTYMNESWNFDERMSISGFPILPYNTDLYKAWASQSLNMWNITRQQTNASATLGLTTSALSLLGGVMTGNYAMAGYGAVSGVSTLVSSLYKNKSLMAELEVKQSMPEQAKNTGCPNSLSAVDRQWFEFHLKQIKPEYAKIIDDYFDVYGYATNRVKTPNIGTRPHWNYVKTVGCNIVGSVPCDDLKNICAIFDHGITFWKHGSEIGRYSELDNRV